MLSIFKREEERIRVIDIAHSEVKIQVRLFFF